MNKVLIGVGGVVAGVAITGIMCYQGLLPKPEDPEPIPVVKPCPVNTYSVTYTTDATDNSMIVADKLIIGTVYKGDIVKFVNNTGAQITIDFSEAGTPFYGNPVFTIAPPGDGTNIEAKVVAVHSPADPPADTDYAYDTTPPIQHTEQSPKVRVGPRRPCVQDEDGD